MPGTDDLEPTALDIAQATLLGPAGLDAPATERVFGTILAHKADDADLPLRVSGHAVVYRRCAIGYPHALTDRVTRGLAHEIPADRWRAAISASFASSASRVTTPLSSSA